MYPVHQGYIESNVTKLKNSRGLTVLISYTVNKGHSFFSISRQELIAISLLSLYSVIEGLVVGLGLTNNNVWQLFAVILVHQIITSISLGKDNSKNGF